MERNPDEVLPARAGGVVPVEQARRLANLAMIGLILFLIEWNFFLLVASFQSMPRNDFGRPLLSTRAFLEGKDMYAPTDAVVIRYGQDKVLHLWNLNPPHSHLLYLPLAVIPPWSALLAWWVLGGLCLYGSIRIILSEVGIKLTPRRKRWMVVGLLSFSAMGVAVVTAHMSFPLMLMITMAWRDARHGRWGKAGSWLGLALSIKPFLLIFIPYLVLKRCWRGVAAVGLSTGLAFLLGLLVFGPESHQSWLRVLSRADSWAWLPLNASLYGILSRVLMKNPMFTPMVALDPGLVRAAWLALGIPAGLVALVRTLTDSSSEGTDRAFAILLVSALLLSPLGWIYYFWLPVGPIAAMARDWWIERSKIVGGGRTAIGSPSGYLFLASMMGMTTPMFVASTLQPSALATVLIASIHFWSLVLVWLALILDGLDLRPARARVIPFVRLMRGSWGGPKLISGSR
jgi:hypothetical protein